MRVVCKKRRELVRTHENLHLIDRPDNRRPFPKQYGELKQNHNLNRRHRRISALWYVIPLLYLNKDETSAFNRTTREKKPTPYWNEVKARSLPFPFQDRSQMALRTGKAFPRARIGKEGLVGYFALNGGAT